MSKKFIKADTHEVILQRLDTTPEMEYDIHENSNVTILMYADRVALIEASVKVHLLGSGSHVNIFGVFFPEANQVLKLHTLQHHQALSTTSNLLVKSVLRNSSTFSYDGAIRVEKEGQKTDAYQRNENLLLAPNAFAQSKPSLEILADDVRCTHGATIGSVDDEQLFYLETRGIDSEKGKELIIEGFLNSVLDRIDDEDKIDTVKKILWNNL